MQEDQLINWIRDRALTHDLLVPIGDDTAAIALRSGYQLQAADMLIEGVHFTRKHIPPAHIGWKSVAVNVSDIAAMGGTPHTLLLSLGLPRQIEEEWIKAFLNGFFEAVEHYGLILAGGDTVASPSGVIVSIAMTGWTPRPLRRDTAKEGDIIAVTGDFGASAAGLWAIARPEFSNHPIRERHSRPQARIQSGLALNELSSPVALLDCSDGLARSIQLLTGDRLGAHLIAEDIPISDATREIAAIAGVDPLHWALYGGEDYELLTAIAPEDWEKAQALVAEAGETTLTAIGRITPRSHGLKVEANTQIAPIDSQAIFQHFLTKTQQA